MRLAKHGTVPIPDYNHHTARSCRVNDLLPGRPLATLVLYAALLIYLCCGMVTTHYALRASLEVLLTGTTGSLTRSRRVCGQGFNGKGG
jgi:hypothetical protein